MKYFNLLNGIRQIIFLACFSFISGPALAQTDPFDAAMSIVKSKQTVLVAVMEVDAIRGLHLKGSVDGFNKVLSISRQREGQPQAALGKYVFSPPQAEELVRLVEPQIPSWKLELLSQIRQGLQSPLDPHMPSFAHIEKLSPRVSSEVPRMNPAQFSMLVELIQASDLVAFMSDVRLGRQSITVNFQAPAGQMLAADISIDRRLLGGIEVKTSTASVLRLHFDEDRARLKVLIALIQDKLERHDCGKLLSQKSSL